MPDAIAITVRHRECGNSWHVGLVAAPYGEVCISDEQSMHIERAVKATGATHTGNVPGATYISWTECRTEFEV
ncbi:hypothetical protein GCM10017596_21140 [Microbacterium keratanolyticum]|uniref:Uncharacterized protein n=1 Tax=Microbacterium keratanolyticum TaxID=67574 RepID=A0A9W6HTK3_9MICO|nr:hypothetical protein GCM10017596_21140 [Microbacterium keratanolyticum]